MADDAKIQSSTILAEILRNIFSEDNPVMTLKFHRANGQVPQDILGVYMYSLVRDQFPHATLDVIVHDIARVMMFSLQAPKYTTFDAWYRSFMQKIEDLNLLYGQITWDQVYLAMVIWALELMGGKYQLLRQHVKLMLPSKTKELLKEPNETLDKVIDMARKWESPAMSYHYAKEIKGQTDGYKQVAFKIMCDMIGLPLQHLQSAAATITTTLTLPSSAAANKCVRRVSRAELRC